MEDEISLFFLLCFVGVIWEIRVAVWVQTKNKCVFLFFLYFYYRNLLFLPQFSVAISCAFSTQSTNTSPSIFKIVFMLL